MPLLSYCFGCLMASMERFDMHYKCDECGHVFDESEADSKMIKESSPAYGNRGAQMVSCLIMACPECFSDELDEHQPEEEESSDDDPN